MRDGSALEDIKLCIVDTTECPDRSFVRDIDLIRSFSLFDIGLRDLKNLRLGKSQSKSSGCYYFGEYLSQGALRIEGRCQIVSAMDIINGGCTRCCLSWRSLRTGTATRSLPARGWWSGSARAWDQGSVRTALEAADGCEPDCTYPERLLRCRDFEGISRRTIHR
ncbi:unnamed protein product, partial [Clonostachys rosea f. rosea IK726]